MRIIRSLVLVVLLQGALSAQEVRPALVKAAPAAETPPAGEPAKAAPATPNAAVKKSIEVLRKALEAFPNTTTARADLLLALDLDTATALGELQSLAAETPALGRQVNLLRRSVSTLQTTVTGLQQDAVKRQEATGTALLAIREIELALGLDEKEKAFKVPESVANACNGLADPPKTDYHFTDLQSLSGSVTAADVQKLKEGKFEVDGLLNANTTIKAYALTGVCAAILESQRSEATDGDTPAGHRALIEAQLSLSRLVKWQRSMASQLPVTDDTTRARRQVSDASSTVENQMHEHGLKRLLSASMFAGTIQGPSGVTLEGDSVVAARENATQVKQTFKAQPSAILNVDSLHYGWEGDHLLDASVRGSTGFRPVQTIVSVGGSASKATTKTETSTTTAGGTTTVVKTDVTTTDSTTLVPTMASVLQQAFVFSGGGRVGLSSKAKIETSISGQFFASVLTDDELLVESANATSVVATGANDSGLAAGGGEFGLDVRFYDTPLRVIHGEGSTVSPGISFGTGLRYDSRFRASGALKDLDLKHSERRWYLRLTFDPVKFLDSREVGDKPKTYDLGIGIEYEGPFKTGGSIKVPQSFRFLIRGDFNILSAAGGGDAKKKEEKKDEKK